MKFYRIFVLDSGMRTEGYWIEGGLNLKSAQHEAKTLKESGYIVSIFPAN
jgi:hypothetical protein